MAVLMSKKIAVFTGTRAEYGLLFWLLKDIQNDKELHLQLLVSGMHLSPEFGLTWKKIEDDGFPIDEKIEILLSSDTATGTAKSIGLGIIGFTDALNRLKPDVIIILGDRFEALAAAQTAMILRIPILHLHGGEVTEGAYDDSIRHSITKLSYLHGTSTEESRNRVIQLGESPERVVNVGAPGLDHLTRSNFLNLSELSTSLNFQLERPFMLVTYHPVTLSDEPPQESFKALLLALNNFPDYKIILTYPNADDGGRKIIPLLEKYASDNPKRVLAIPSMGQERYLSAIKLASVVVGNSSSGIIEVPSFGVPTVDIGARQKGRLRSQTVLHAEPETEDISKMIDKALSKEFTRRIHLYENPYGQGNSSKKIIDMIKSMKFSPEKKFHDLRE